MGRQRMGFAGAAFVFGLTATSCGAPITAQAPQGAYMLVADDMTWYLLIQVDNGIGTADAAVSNPGGGPLIDHGTVIITNGVITFTGIMDIQAFSSGCQCHYQFSRSDILVSLPTPDGLEQVTFRPSSSSQYNAGVRALTR